MNVKLNYGPNNLAYYTTWWLTSKRSNSSQTVQSESVRNSIKSDDEFFMIQQVSIHIIEYLL